MLKQFFYSNKEIALILKNNQTISVTPIITKILESVVYNQLYEYLTVKKAY